jgi:MFS family permease
VLVGLGLLALAGVIAISGIAAWNFTLSLILLGLGWNFGYIGATAIVTDCHTPAERGKVQALNDLLVFGFVTVATWLSGYMFHSYGWAALNGLLLAAVAVGTVAVLYARRGGAAART